MATQLDSLSIATDNSDNGRPMVSKFPKTRPAELNCKQGESGQKISLFTNYIKILAAPKCKIFVFLICFHLSIIIENFLRGFISI